MPANRSAYPVIALIAVALLGCAREKSAVPERLAVTPFSNLSANSEFDWLRRALSAVIVNDLTGLPKTYAQSVDSWDGAYAMQASRVVEGYLIQSNGRLEIHATVLELATKKIVASFVVDGPVAQGEIALASEAAKKLNPEAHAFSTSNERAFRAFGEALGGGDRDSVLRALEAATRSDPRFSLAYREWAQVLASGGDREGALRVIQEAKRSQPDSIASTRLNFLEASIRADPAAREQALVALAQLMPADATVSEELGELELSQRKFSKAVVSYGTAAGLDPDNPAIWNELGYARAFDGDLRGARTALEQYQRLVPAENVNPLDSLGEVSFYLGDFGDAEKYFLEADRRNPGEFGGADLLKAAQARLMTGDDKGAEGLYEKYLGRQRGRIPFQGAQWQFLTGRRKAAMAGLEKMIPKLKGDVLSLALDQLSFWELESGDRKSAELLASRAGESAVGPAAQNLSKLSRAIAESEGGTSGSGLEDAYALLFAGKFAEAAPVLEKLYREANPHNDGEVRTLLAWVYVKTGRTSDARSLVNAYPIPLSSSDTMFASLIFPRYLFVRGAVLQQEGKRAEAKAAYELFLKYSGDVPDIFGDEAAARKNLSTL